MSDPVQLLPPGFRFHPTDEELILHYMRNRAASAPCPAAIIADVDIYKFDPWELPAKAMFGDREWYFFSPRLRKYPNGVRPNRAAASGYWKATGTDKPICCTAANGNNDRIGVKKALVFYTGKPPKGLKTNWIMHEYRLAGAQSSTNSYKPSDQRDASSMRLDDWVLCRIYKKSSHQPLMDREQEDPCVDYSSPSTSSLQNVLHQDDDLKLSKSSSLSDFLDRYSELSHMFDNPDSFIGNPISIAGQPMIISSSSNNSSNGINYLVHQLSQPQSPASIAESSLKRKRWNNPTASPASAQPPTSYDDELASVQSWNPQRTSYNKDFRR